MSPALTLTLVLTALLLTVVGVMAYSFIATDESTSFPAPAVEAFQSQCVNSGASPQTCACLLEEMEQRYSLDELIRLGLQARNTGQVPDELRGLVERCGG